MCALQLYSLLVFLTVFYSSASQPVRCRPSNEHWLVSKRLPPLARVSANSCKLGTRLDPAVSGWLLLLHSVINFVMNAVWILLHRLLFCLFTFSQITEPKSTFICVWSPWNIWRFKGALYRLIRASLTQGEVETQWRKHLALFQNLVNGKCMK